METTTLENDIKVFYVTAASFPDGIKDAHERLHALVPVSADRKFYGISRPENGPIVYRAAAEEIREGEAAELNCETLVLKKGEYTSLTIHNYMEDIQSIGRAFEELLSHTGLDPKGYCVEWYLSDKVVICMIRLAE